MVRIKQCVPGAADEWTRAGMVVIVQEEICFMEYDVIIIGAGPGGIL